MIFEEAKFNDLSLEIVEILGTTIVKEVNNNVDAIANKGETCKIKVASDEGID